MDDLISRQDAIDLLDEQIAICNRALTNPSISMNDEFAVKVERNSLMAYRDKLECMPSAQSEQSWIPCSERLPDPYVEVLVSDVDGDVGIAWFENEWNEWWSDRYGIIEVLAWMPLPESYKGEKHE